MMRQSAQMNTNGLFRDGAIDRRKVGSFILGEAFCNSDWAAWCQINLSPTHRPHWALPRHHLQGPEFRS